LKLLKLHESLGPSMSVEPQPVNSGDEMTGEEEQTALALIRTLEEQIRRLEQQLLELRENSVCESEPIDPPPEDEAARKQS
jgi:hypothetical protein